VSHFLEHLLFKGTPTRSARDISRQVDRVGGDVNAYTAKENTTFYCRMPARHAVGAVELLADVVCSPLLDPSEVESERHVILEELAMDDDVPDEVVHRAFAEQLFPGHPLGRDTGGDRETVRRITAGDVRGFHERFYGASSLVVSIAGAVDADEMLHTVERAFAVASPSCERPTRAAPAGVGADRHLRDETEQVHMVIGGRGLGRRDADREALDVVNHVLGGGLSSRLFDEIRERRGLVYSVFSGIGGYEDAGVWSVYAGTQPEHASTVRDLIVEIVDAVATDGVTEEELAVAVGYLVGAYELGLEDSGARMSRLGGMLTLLGEVRPVEEQIARWESVTLDDAARVAADVLGSGRTMVSVGPG
jgi:predicted Zn-dependent peptidase